MALRIVQVSAYGLKRHGGVQSHVRDIANALVQRGHLVRCYCPPIENSSPDFSSIDVYEVGKKRNINLAQTRYELSYIPKARLVAIAAEVNEWKPDIVHIHGIWVPFLPWQLASAIQAAKVVSFHDTTTPNLAGFVLKSFFKPLSRVIAKRVDGLISTSEAPMTHLGPASTVQEVSIFPPVVDLSDFFSIAEKTPSDNPIVLHWGRLDRRKNIATLLQAARLIWRDDFLWPKDVNKPCFVIAGNGTDENLVSIATRELGPQAMRQVAAPDGNALLSFLHQADLCVFPAKYGEGFGIVLIEALASGTPILAGDNPGFRANLGVDGSEFLFNADDPLELASKIATFFSNITLRPKIIKWGREHARRFDVAKNMDQLESIYYRAIQSKRSKVEVFGNQV